MEDPSLAGRWIRSERKSEKGVKVQWLLTPFTLAGSGALLEGEPSAVLKSLP
jgi:hypothetical protein